MKSEYITFLKIILKDKSLIRFGLGVFLGLSFSMAVILATIGIMDGFDFSLKSALKKSMGDITIFSREGFFEYDDTFQESFKELGISTFSPLVQVEGFLISNETTYGVMIKGVVASEFSKVTKINLNITDEEVALGSELAKDIGKKVGDDIVLAFASGNKEFSGLPLLQRVKIGQIVHHKIYQKDKRLMYMNRSILQSALKLGNFVNIISLNILKAEKLDFSHDSVEYIDEVNKTSALLRDSLGFEFAIRPFWSEFSSLLEAVKVEKLIIGLILQLVVIISIFNVMAFVIYLNEKKIKEIFLLGALGMSRDRIYRGWIFLMTGIWILASANSLLFLELFDYALLNLSFLKLPGEIYHLGRLSLSLDFFDFLIVFSATYFWLQLVAWIGLRRLRAHSLLVGLRKEFS